MATYTQKNRPMAVTTPLDPDVLLLTGFTGHEGISQLFRFELDLLAENGTSIAFDQLLGQPVTVDLELSGGKKRHFNGIVSRFGEGLRDNRFTAYRAEVVPRFWLWSRRVQSRIFQHTTIPEILKQVLEGLDVTFEISGAFHTRDYCVQYRESDYAFANRLMEEEGIYYYFTHTAGGHKMVVANTPQSHRDVPEQSTVIFEEVIDGSRRDDRVLEWEKVQELRAGKLRLWDHCFELPHQHLEGTRTIQDSVSVGAVTHKLKVGGNDRLHIHDYPGGYAQRFDGVDAGGGDRAGDLAKIFQDAERTVAIRMQREASKSVEIRGLGRCRQFVTGHKFTLQRHFNADGVYVLTTVRHSAQLGGAYHTGNGHPETLTYENTFTCIPLALPFRPPLLTPKPMIAGPQTAVVVGSPGEKIFCDKYGRVKVKFHWDPIPKKDANSSCWIRVSNNWGGSRWGGMFLPHVGQEVIVEFEEGDPDRPVITGRVYNAECMPPRVLPANKTQCNISDHGGDYILCEGADGKQQVDIHSTTAHTQLTLGKALSEAGTHHYPAFPVTFALGETAGPLDGFNMATDAHWLVNIGANAYFRIGANWSIYVHDNWKVHVHGNHKEEIDGHEVESVKLFKHSQVGGFLHEMVGGFRVNTVGLFRAEVVGGYKKEVVLGRKNSSIGSNLTETIKGNHKETTGGDILIEAAKRGGERILLQCGASSIELHKNGTITIKGKVINLHAEEDINGDAKKALRLRGDKGFALSSSNGEGQVNSHDELVLQGKEFALTSTQGQGEVNAKTILNVKGSSMVKINC
jgi:type VI secretion system secreted protein VgrG